MSDREIFEEIATLERLIHEPARLAIMTALSSVEEADFLLLQRLTGLTKGNLSSHLTKLENAELLEIEKSFRGKRTHTNLKLTRKGRKRIETHWKKLDSLRKSAGNK